MAAVGIIIHISVGAEKRTEYFVDDHIRIGSNENSDVQIHTDKIDSHDVWLELELTEDVYRVINYKESLNLELNGKPLRRFAAVRDGDKIEIPSNDISFDFFSLASRSAMITTKREPHMARFIEEAALDAAT